MLGLPNKNKKIKRIQKAANKISLRLRNLPDEEKLSRLNLPNEDVKKEKGDLIAVYRVIKEVKKLDR